MYFLVAESQITNADLLSPWQRETDRHASPFISPAWLVLVHGSSHPDFAFRLFTALKFVNLQILCNSETSTNRFWGSEMVKCSVGSQHFVRMVSDWGRVSKWEITITLFILPFPLFGSFHFWPGFDLPWEKKEKLKVLFSRHVTTWSNWAREGEKNEPCKLSGEISPCKKRVPDYLRDKPAFFLLPYSSSSKMKSFLADP